MLNRLLPGRLVVMTMLAGGLYLGPLLAGLSRQPPWTIVAFAAILILWSVLYRSAHWPGRIADLARPEVVVALVLPVGVILVLSSLFFVAGLGLSRVAGTLSLPLPVSLGIPILCLIAALFLHSPRKAAAMDAFLDDALRQLQGFPAGPALSGPSPAAKAVVERLAGLPEDATVAEVQAIVGATSCDDAALLAAIDATGIPPPRTALVAAVLIVTDPAGGSGPEGRGEASWVFDALRGAPDLEALFAGRAVALLARSPHLWRDMPYAYDVAEAAARSPDPEAARALDDLCRRLNEISEAQDGPGPAVTAV